MCLILPFNNVLHVKMALKTHLFIKNILLSLQKLCQYIIWNKFCLKNA